LPLLPALALRDEFELDTEMLEEFELELLAESEFELLAEFELEPLAEFELELLAEFELELFAASAFELLAEFELELVAVAGVEASAPASTAVAAPLAAACFQRRPRDIRFHVRSSIVPSFIRLLGRAIVGSGDEVWLSRRLENPQPTSAPKSSARSVAISVTAEAT
jgi:hypothetical protein